MDTTATIITFFLYFVFMLFIGIYFYKRNRNIEDYLLGGRSLGKWVTAISAQASDMSGWLLMGLPGAVYLFGLNQCWIAVGLTIGTFLNWHLISEKLRVATEKTESMTLSGFFAKKYNDKSGLLQSVSAVIILIFFTIYTSSGLVGAGKLFESMFGIDYRNAVLIGSAAIVLYTLLGGFMAVCWTDLFQGMLMFAAIILVPLFAVIKAPEMNVQMTINSNYLDILNTGGGSFSLLALLSSMAWGLGYFGQPHILTRFMSVKSVSELKQSKIIAMVWVIISLAGAVIIGLVAKPYFSALPEGNHEKVFIFLIQKLFNPWISGILLAAILAAIMSTIDSQLLVSSSTLTEDFYKFFIRKNSSEKELMWVGRGCVLLIAVIAVLMAMVPGNTVLSLVSYAWGGLGASFGPLVITALYSRNISWKSAFAGMTTGALTVIIWKNFPLLPVYEIIPGFIFNFAAIYIVQKLLAVREIEARESVTIK